MIIAFQRTVGSSSMSMITDEDWTAVKVTMCQRWAVEKPFDHHHIWERLNNGQVVTYDGDMYQVWDTAAEGDYADELFQGRHIEIIDEESGR